MSNVLSLRGITRFYQTPAARLEVLRGVDFDVKPGELVALIGPSGSGKSTLLQIAGLLDRPQTGEVQLAGGEVTKASDAARTKLRNRHLGFIYQFHNLLGELSAEENIAIPMRLAGVSAKEASQRALALLARLGLEARRSHLPSQLSGGEQQRVAIARALANKPALLLADEPTGNLDPATSESVLALFLEIAREENVAAVIATHNMDLAKRLHRAVTLREGRIEQATV